MKSGKAAIKPPRIHLAAIGDELLNAEIRESNLAWLINTFTRRGGKVLRAIIIPDDFEAIGDEISLAKRKKVDLLITTGGLGPTDDDATLRAVAKALNVPFRLDKRALSMVKKRLDALAVFRPGIPQTLNAERKSQAYMPDGAVPLFNPVGVAPGMIYDLGRTKLISLPGVPQEMKGILTETLKDLWEEMFRDVVYVRRNISIRGIPEAELAPFIRRVSKLDSEIYIKSRLWLKGKRVPTKKVLPPEKLPWKILLHFSLISRSRKEGMERINRLIDSIVADIEKRYKYPFHFEKR